MRTPRVTARTALVAPLLFSSGACALVYQAAWFRELRLVFGASTAASAAVLGVFMAGLGVGGRLLGARADRAKRPLMMYANLELGVSALAAITPLLASAVRKLYVGVGGSASLGTVGATLLRLVLAALVLAGPTLLMGGTLPAAVRAVEADEDAGRRRVAALYGANTLGAVLGTALASFLLFEVFGTRMTLWVACLVNALVGMIARGVGRDVGPEAEDAAKAKSDAGSEPGSESKEKAKAEADPEPAAATGPAWFPAAAAGAVGFAFMLMEIVWYRMLAPLLGGSSYTFGLILTVALLGIGIGGAMHAFGRAPATLRVFAVTCALEALFMAIPFALGDRLAVLALMLRPISAAGFLAQVGAWSFIAAVVVLPAAVVSGIQFPVIISLYGRGRDRVGKHVGHAYMANTVGGILGSLAGGFGLLPLLSATGAWKLVIALLVVCAVVALVLAPRPATTRVDAAIGALALGASALSIAGLSALGPTAAWRHTGIGAGRAATDLQTKSALVGWARNARRAIAWQADGVESGVALSKTNGYAFIVNGKSDGHATGDAPTQVMSGLIGAMVHGAPKSALVVGLGTGSTAGWLAAIPEVERVDVLEIEPTIVRVARACAPVNAGAMDNPKLHLTFGDAREALLVSRQQYDVVFSEPSNPFRAGISSLYTREFYEAVRGRLSPRGIFVQWVQSYEIDGRALESVIATLKTTFGDVTIWQPETGDLLLLAREKPEPLDMDRLRALSAAEPYRSALADVWRTSTAEGLLAHFVANATLTNAVAKQTTALNTDDDNLLEFALARTVGVQQVSSEDIFLLSARLGANRPLVRGAVSWEEVQTEVWLDRLRAGQSAPQPAPGMPEPVRAFVRSLDAFSGKRFVPFLVDWKAAGRASPGVSEIAMVVEAAASVGDEETFAAWIDRHRDPVERELLRARLLATRERHGEAAAALERGFTLHRTHPWARRDVVRAGFDLARDLARRDAKLAPRFVDALLEPFAVHQLDDARLKAALDLATAARDAGRCAKVLASLEPDTPWDGDLLRARVACYRATGDGRVARAEKELLEFLETEPSHVGESISAPAP